MECYNDFANIYDNLIREDVDYSKMSDFILNQCNLQGVKYEEFLDLACGTGNITELIAPHFNKNFAVDLSCDMLSNADNKFRDKGLKINVLCSDMTEFRINTKFNLITCCLDSINYILEEQKIASLFSNIYSMLDDEGIFIFDINSEYKIKNILGNNTFNYDSDKATYIWENSLCGDIVQMNLTFFVPKGEIFIRFDEEHIERAFSIEFMDKALKANLLDYKVYADYSDIKITKDTERLTYVVKKRR